MNNNSSTDLLGRAKADLAENMNQRQIGAILWDNATAGFPYLPEISLPMKEDQEEPETVSVMGIYNYGGVLYLIEEGESHVDFNHYWDPDNETKPTIITLTPDVAARDFGNPEGEKGFTANADLEEWLAIADCYFQALAEEDTEE